MRNNKKRFWHKMHHILPDNSGHITLDGQRHGFLQKAHLRMAMVTCVLMLGFIAIAWRLTHLSLIGVYAPGTAAAGQMQTAGITALRGGITDRNGEHIAATLRMPSLYADPALVGNADILARDLSKILPVTATDIKHNLARGGRFVWLYRNLTPKQQQRINDLGYPELGFRDEYRRIYPQGNLLSHLLGYTDSDGNGIAGLEKQYNDLLKEGDVLRTTLDIRVQNILKRTIQQSVTRFQAIGGAGIMMDIKTGEIIAMVSLPDFDPHNPADAPAEKRFNRNTTGVFEMGSTFKIFSIAAALQNGSTTADEVFDATEPLRIGRHVIRDFHAEKRPMTVREIFLHSSNIGTALIAQKMGSENLQNFFRDLGLFTRVNIDLPERALPLVPRRWGEAATATASYGHGFAVTPLHLAVGAAAIVNNGLLLPPTLTPRPRLKTAATRIVSAQTSAVMRSMLEDVTAKGTGKNAVAAGYRVGGKTGTAEKVVNGRYKRKALYSSFIGFFPMDNPRYVLLVSIDEPQGRKDSFGYATGGWTAAPVVRQVITEAAPLLGIASGNMTYGGLRDYVVAISQTNTD
jgi:cell division protein FtsI (penicillin-binding protein 3)